MSEVMQANTVPEWTIGDRLRKAREVAGLKQSELAETMGIARSSVINYESGKTVPSRPNVLAWAFATGVRLDWLQTGTAPGQGGPDGGPELPRLDSNQQPAGLLPSWAHLSTGRIGRLAYTDIGLSAA